MNIKTLILSLGFVSMALSCANQAGERYEMGTIVRDCTGTYVRIASKGDFLVCNDKLIADKKEGEKLNVSYEIIKDCSERNGIVSCMMYHENKGMIKIKSVK